MVKLAGVIMAALAVVGITVLVLPSSEQHAAMAGWAQRAAADAGLRGDDAHYLDPIEMVCHYYPLEAERVRARADVQDALRHQWVACWTEGTEMAGWAQNWGQYGPHADSPHKWFELLRQYAHEARMTRAEQAVWLAVRYRETAERLALSAGVEYAMRHDGGPIFR